MLIWTSFCIHLGSHFRVSWDWIPRLVMAWPRGINTLKALDRFCELLSESCPNLYTSPVGLLPRGLLVVQPLSCVWLFATPWMAAHQTPLSSAVSQSLLRFMSIESVMLSNHLILCHPLLFLPSIFPSIRVFSSESALRIRWPKYWSFNFNISPSNEYSGLISFRIYWFDLLAVQGTPRIFSSTTVWKHCFFVTQSSLWPNSHIHTWLLEKP